MTKTPMASMRALYASPLGMIEILCNDDGIQSILFIEDRGENIEEPSLPLLRRAIRMLDDYFAGQSVAFHTLPMRPQGTAFQQKVWEVLRRIPYGKTITYGDIASALGTRGAQAVGNAVGANPLCIAVPCHRVVPRNATPGNWGNFAAGKERKEWLLIREGVQK